MGWIIPSLGSLAAGAADDAILREQRERRRRGRTSATRAPSVNEQELIDSIIRLPLHVRVESVRRPSFRDRSD